MSHTPGPWKIERHYDPGYKNISAQKHTALAQVVWCMEDEDRSPECEANAHLIAAAPELLDALCYLLEASSGQGPHEQWLAAMDQARAAIAKATGVLAEGDSEVS
jgi:hypothetical protein